MISLTSPVKTWAHDWPAGAKLAALCVTTVILFRVESTLVHVAALAGVALLYALPGGVFLRAGVRRLRVLWPFLALIVLWHAVTGTLDQGAVIGLRLVSAVACANLVTMTTRLDDMMGVVGFLAAPLRRLGVPTAALELAIALVIRFTPVLVDKGTALTQAWRARASRRPGWRIILPFAILAMDDADHIADALRARGGVLPDTET